MKIGIDISQVAYETGVSVYTRSLVRALLQVDRKNEYVLFGGSLRRKRVLRDYLDNLKGNFTGKILSIPPTLAEILGNRIRLGNIEMLVGKLDVFHLSDWVQPRSSAFKVTTVHDLAPLKFPQETHPRVVGVHKRRLKLVKKEVDRIIVPSVSTKNDLIEYGISETKIQVIPEAIEKGFGPSKKRLIKSKYLLAVGTAKRKNLDRIIAAFEKIKSTVDVDKLVIVGRVGKTVAQRPDVVYTGYVTDEELPIYYSGAEVLVYASLYEGFGQPILQAMACGCPVVTSNISSLPEVAGNAAVLVDPKSVDSIADGIKSALRKRKSLIKKGFKQVKKFSWQHAARKTLKVYEEA